MGYQTAHRLTLRVDLPTGEYSAPELLIFVRQLEQEVQGLPGVQSAAVTSDLPLGDRQLVGRAYLQQSAAAKPEQGIQVFQHAVTPTFFQTMGIPLASGRVFTPTDDERAPRVAILSRGMTSRLWPTSSPVGQRLRLATLESKNNWVTVVGVVADVRFRSLAQDPEQDFDLYLPFSQTPSPSLGLVVQTPADPTGVIAAMRRTVHGLKPNLALYEVKTLDERVAHEASDSRIGALATSLCAILAIGMAMFGLYGSLAYSASQRSREMGIRLALGAQHSDLIKLGLWEGARVATAGVGAGLVVAFLVAKALRGLLFGISTNDPVILLGVAGLVIAASLLASFLSARRVLRVSPIRAIRES
jgi:predicted permease